MTDTTPARTRADATRGRRRDTKLLLLDAAERLFALHGPRNTPLRRIVEAAGVDLGAVRYHFGSKQGLFEAVVRRCIEPQVELRMARLDELDRDHPEPTLEQAFDAYFEPVVAASTEPERGPQRSLLMLHGIYAHETYWPIVGKYFPRYSARVKDALARALPGVPRDEVEHRFNAAHLLVLMALVPQTGNVDDPRALPEGTVDRLRSSALAILRVDRGATTA